MSVIGNPIFLRRPSYVTLWSDSAFFTFGTNGRYYDGTLYYSKDAQTWTAYSFGNITVDVGEKLYLRGVGITTFRRYNADTYTKFIINGSGVHCDGDIATLLDYQAVERGESPTTSAYTFTHLFISCTALVSAPRLTLKNLKAYAYEDMFWGCTSLASMPQIDATTAEYFAMQEMFYGCTSLSSVSPIKLTAIPQSCCSRMFYNCTSITETPTFAAANVGYYGCSEMFYGCTSLITAHAPLATSFTANNAMYRMFYGCTSLVNPPTLSATTLYYACYSNMFKGCTSLTQAPALPALSVPMYAYGSMFEGCTALTTPPSLPATALAAYAYSNMFFGCTALNTLPYLPATSFTDDNGDYYTYNQMFQNCTNIKVSTTQGGIYDYAYRIPKEGSATSSGYKTYAMFSGTGGTFTGTPSVNTTYYTDHEPV